MSPDIAVPATPGSIALSFRHSYHTESNFDGSVLEVKVGAGGFQDVLAAGGSFVESGDNRTLASGFGNPIGGRQAWRGTSGGFVTTTVSLPASPSGQTIQLRWRLGSDASVRGTGWYVDTIAFLAGSTCCVPSLPSVSPSSGSGPGPVTVSWTEDTGIQRTDAATIAGQTFTVTQVGPGNYFTVPPLPPGRHPPARSLERPHPLRHEQDLPRRGELLRADVRDGGCVQRHRHVAHDDRELPALPWPGDPAGLDHRLPGGPDARHGALISESRRRPLRSSPRRPDQERRRAHPFASGSVLPSTGAMIRSSPMSRSNWSG